MLRHAFSRAAGHLPKQAEVGFFGDILGAILEERPDLKALFTKHTTSVFLGTVPNFNEPMIYFPKQGNSAYTVIVRKKEGEEEVFKAPRIDNISDDNEFKEVYAWDRVEQIKLEGRVLEHLHGMGLPVPELTYEGKETVFIGMTRMKGVKLDSVVIDKMTYQEKRQLAKDIAGFIAGFENAISDRDAEILGFNGDAYTTWELKPEDSQLALSNSAVIKALGENADFCRDMQKAFEKKYEKEYRDVPQVPSHGDLHFGNILYDPETKKLSGVIDFGGVGFTRPELNFGAFSQKCKDDFTSMLCEEYSEKSGNKITLQDVHITECARWINFLPAVLEGKDEKQLQYAKDRISKLIKSLSTEPEKVALPQTPKKQQFTKG